MDGLLQSVRQISNKFKTITEDLEVFIVVFWVSGFVLPPQHVGAEHPPKFLISCFHWQRISKEAGFSVRLGKCTISATATSASCRRPISGGPLGTRTPSQQTTPTTIHPWRMVSQPKPWTASRAQSASVTASSTCASPWYRHTCSRLSTCWVSLGTDSRASPPLCMQARARTWRPL